MKEVVKGQASDSMDTLVQQTESPFTFEVLHFPLPAKFRMPQIEVLDGTKDLVDHLNTYKNDECLKHSCHTRICLIVLALFYS